jgi:hypothetical protein
MARNPKIAVVRGRMSRNASNARTSDSTSPVVKIRRAGLVCDDLRGIGSGCPWSITGPSGEPEVIGVV